MLGPFATASRRTPPVLRCHSPGVATVARRLRIDVHDMDFHDIHSILLTFKPLNYMFYFTLDHS